MPPIQTIYNTIKPQDAIAWQVNNFMRNAVDPGEVAEGQQKVVQLLAYMKDDLIRQNYFDQICSERKWKQKKQLQSALDNLTSKKEATAKPTIPSDITGEADEDMESLDESKLPKWITRENIAEFFRKGYFISNRKIKDDFRYGFYSVSISRTEGGTSYTAIQITNFTVQPLFHIYAGAKSRHMIKIDNGYMQSILDVESAKIPSPDQFQAISVTEGNFVIFGNKNQWLRIASDLLQHFPRCIELEELGYQSQGFWAYSDYIHQPGAGRLTVDNYGIFKHGKERYLLPQQCEAYRQLIKTGGDPFENDRFLRYAPSPITFTDWASKMNRVFGIKSAVSISWLIFCLFRDVVMQTTSTSPHLYFYGPTNGGKSAAANALCSLFYVGRKPFIAYEGTIFAFYAYLSRFKNAPAFINEFDTATTDMDRVQAIKGVFDGEGRERGKKEGGRRATEVQKIECGLLLCGQYLATIDDNSIVNRSIVEDFLPDENRTEEDMREFNDLKDISTHGITSLLTELLNMRGYFEANFRTMYLELLGKWIRQSQRDNKPLVQRIMQNYCMMATCYQMLSSHYPLMPVSVEEHTAYCLAQARKWSAFVSSSDTLSDFWKFVSYLFDLGIVVDGWDVIVEPAFTIELRDGERKTWDAGHTVLYLRLNNVHKQYQKEYKLRYGKEAMTESNLLHYFTSKKYYIGPVKQKWFKRAKTHTKENESGTPFQQLETERTQTSCYAFSYDEIARQVDGFNLVRENGMEKFITKETQNDIMPSGITRGEMVELFEK